MRDQLEQKLHFIMESTRKQIELKGIARGIEQLSILKSGLKEIICFMQKIELKSDLNSGSKMFICLIRLRVRGSNADYLLRYMRNGQEMAVQGYFSQRIGRDENGKIFTIREIFVKDVILLST